MLRVDNKQAHNARYAAFRSSRDERTAAFDMVGGGDYEKVGYTERVILDNYAPVQHGGMLVDIGCGPGRLARYLSDRVDLRYLGTDVVGELLEVAARECARPDWRFEEVEGFVIPEADAVADVVAIFSVFTNIYPEQSFLLVREAARVLRPGGTLLVSYMDIRLERQKSVFLNLVEHQDRRIDPLVFLDDNFLGFFCQSNGFEIPTFLHPEAQDLKASPNGRLLDGRPIEGGLSLGQTLMIAKRAAR